MQWQWDVHVDLRDTNFIINVANSIYTIIREPAQMLRENAITRSKRRSERVHDVRLLCVCIFGGDTTTVVCCLIIYKQSHTISFVIRCYLARALSPATDVRFDSRMSCHLLSFALLYFCLVLIYTYRVVSARTRKKQTVHLTQSESNVHCCCDSEDILRDWIRMFYEWS